MRDRPHPQHKLEWPGGVVPEWAKPQNNPNKRRGKGRGGPGKGPGGAGGKRERLQKVMAQSGYGSRRNIEILIAQGHITINGQVAKLGDSVGPGDKVKLDGNVINLRFGEALPRVMLYHKPAGEIVTRDDPENRPTVFEKLPKVNGGRWVSVGRLDFNTEGLLIFTTSGELANRLTHPRFEVEREYAVRVMGELNDEQRAKLLTGIDIDGESCKFDSLEDRGGEGSNHWYHVVLREGRNREVRKMMETAGLMVSRLTRVRFGSVELPSFLKRGMLREMGEEEIQELLAFAGMGERAASDEDEEEDELDNIGNRAPEGYRASRDPEEEEDDVVHEHDDIGNRVTAATGQVVDREPDDIGNRGTYGTPAPQQPGGARRNRGDKPFAFKKRGPPGMHAHGNTQGNTYGNTQGNAHGNTHGNAQGNAHGNTQGNAQPQGQGQGPGQGPGQGQHPRPFRKRGRKKPHGMGQPGQGAPRVQQEAAPQGQPQPQGQPPVPGQGAAPGAGPGQGQGKRHRRNRNRHRNRNARGDRPPASTPPNREEL